MNESLIIPQWSIPKHVGALMTTRNGGVSVPPFNSLNLGDNTTDQACAVAQNKQRLQTWIAASNDQHVTPLAFLNQVHGTDVLSLDDVQIRQAIANGIQFDADASYTTQTGVACVVRVADCLPVLFSAPGIVAAAHAGWRGLAAGILEKTVQTITKVVSCSPDEIQVWLGPCIGVNAFEVGNEVREAFVHNNESHSIAFRATPTPQKWLADLPLLASLILKRQGITKITSDGRCTYQEESLFFSYRRDHMSLGDTGRMAACIWLKGGLLHE